MRNKLYELLSTVIVVSFCLIVGSNTVYGQCGLPGTPPCPATSKATPKKTASARKLPVKPYVAPPRSKALPRSAANKVSPPLRTSEDYFKAGSNCENTDYDCQIINYTKAIKLDPKVSDYYYKRGSSYFNKGDYGDSIVDLSKTIEIDPNYADSYNIRGKVFRKLGQASLAEIDEKKYEEVKQAKLKLLETAASAKNSEKTAQTEKNSLVVEKDADLKDSTKTADYIIKYKASPAEEKKSLVIQKAEMYFNYAKSTCGDDYECKIENLKNSIDLVPTNPNAYYERGNAYLSGQKFDEAIKDFSKAIELNPKLELAYFNRANGFNKKASYDEAILDFNKTIELNPTNSDAYYYRGYSYNRKKNYDEAIKNYSKAIELNPAYSFAYSFRGESYSLKGDYENALKDFTKAIELNPNYVGTYKYRGVAFYRKGNYELAIEDFTKAIKLSPDYADAYYDRANSYQRINNSDSAIQDYTEAIKLKTSQIDDAYNNRGISYYKKGDYPQAVKDFTEAINLNANLANAYKNRGVVYRALKNNNLAEADDKKYQQLTGEQVQSKSSPVEEITKPVSESANTEKVKDSPGKVSTSPEKAAANPEKAAANPEKAIDIGVINNKASKLVSPLYPLAAKAFHVSGKVEVLASIDETGTVISAKFISGNPVFKDASESAARQSKFAPNIVDGKPVKFSGIIVYNFKSN